MDGQVLSAAVETIGVVASGFAATLGVGLITGSYKAILRTQLDKRNNDEPHTVIDGELRHGKGGRVGDTVDSCGRVDNLDILCGFAMISLCPQDDIGYQGLAWYVPEILILRRAYGKKILKLSCFE